MNVKQKPIAVVWKNCKRLFLRYFNYLEEIPFETMMRSIVKFFGISESELDDSDSLLPTLLMIPFRLIWGFIYFMIFAWTTSRSGRSFIFAIPAMLAFIVFVGMVWAIGFKGDLKAVAVSRGYSKLYADERNPLYDTEAARMLAKKVVEEAPEDPVYKYELGLTYELLSLIHI